MYFLSIFIFIDTCYNKIDNFYLKEGHNMYSKILSFIIKALRNRAKLTQKELATKIGKSEILIRKYESGKAKINKDTFFLIVLVLGVTRELLNELLDSNQEEIIKTFDSNKEEFDMVTKWIRQDMNLMIHTWGTSNNTVNAKENLLKSIQAYLNSKVEKDLKKDTEMRKFFLENDMQNEIGQVILQILDFTDFTISKFLDKSRKTKKQQSDEIMSSFFAGISETRDSKK